MIDYNFKDCAATNEGTGLADCFSKWGQPVGFILTPKSWEVATSETFDSAYVNEQIQLGNFIPFLQGFNNFTENTGDPATNESNTGITTVIRNAKPMYQFDFTNGIGWHGSAYSYNSQSKFNVLLVFENGNIGAAISKDGLELSGFTLGSFNVRTYRLQSGTDLEVSQITMQLTNTNQFNTQAVTIEASQLDFEPQELEGVLQVDLGITTAAAGDITMTAKAKLNHAIDITSLTAANVEVTVNGVVDSAATMGAFTDGSYAVTPGVPLAVGDVVSVRLYDIVLDTSVILVSDNFYKGKSAAITVA